MQNLFTAKHIGLFMAGLLVIILGYVLLAQGPEDNPLSLSVAPFLLIGGYCVVIPVAIILKDNGQKKR